MRQHLASRANQPLPREHRELSGTMSFWGDCRLGGPRHRLRVHRSHGEHSGALPVVCPCTRPPPRVSSVVTVVLWAHGSGLGFLLRHQPSSGVSPRKLSELVEVYKMWDFQYLRIRMRILHFNIRGYWMRIVYILLY